jgi:hypothetical protein
MDVKQEDTPASKVETAIPKERLDEVLARAKKAEEQQALLGDLLNKALNRQPQRRVKEVDPPYLAKLKEDSPEMYAAIKTIQAENSQLKAAVFNSNDKGDRAEFLSAYPKKIADRWLPLVEEKLQELRQNGEFGWSRDMIYKHLRGVTAHMDDLKQFDELEDQYKKQTQTTKPKQTTEEADESPSQDPAVSQVARSGSASSKGTGFSIEDFENKYGDQTF